MAAVATMFKIGSEICQNIFEICLLRRDRTLDIHGISYDKLIWVKKTSNLEIYTSSNKSVLAAGKRASVKF